MKSLFHTCSFIFWFASAGLAFAEEKLVVPVQVEDLMANYCFDCHDEDSQKGDIRLDNLFELKLPKRLDLLNRMQEQAFFRHMPPKKKKTQPSEAERKSLVGLDVRSELKQARCLQVWKDKLRKPEYGNYVDHDKLFSGEFKELPGFTYDRRWLISEYIFNDKFDRMLKGQATGYYRGQKSILFSGASDFTG